MFLFPHKIILFDEMGTVYNNLNITETNDIENKKELYVSSCYYESAKKLVDEINAIIAKITTIRAPKLYYNDLNNMITVEPRRVDDSIRVCPSLCSEVGSISRLKNRNMINNYYSLVNHNSGITAAIFNGDEMFKKKYMVLG
jgi:hypothetical protein